MSSAQQNCYNFTCVQKCCNYYGSCPQYQYSSTYLSQCYYYYDNSNTQISSGGLAGIIVGSIVAVTILICVIVCCVKAHKRNQQMKMAIASQNNAANYHNTSVNSFGPSGYQPNQFMIPNNQPSLILYAQPYVNPYVGAPMGPIYSEQIYPPPYRSPDYGANPIIR